MDSLPLLIPGAEPEGDALVVYAPYDRSAIASVETGGTQAVDRALATAEGLFRDRAGWLAAEKRLAVLARAAAIMEERAEELALAAAQEGGKPLLDSRVEVARAIDGVRICIETLRTQAGAEVPMGLNAASAGRLAVTRHEPIGVVVAVSAFNHPLNLIVHQVAPAVAVGCPVVVKPASDTPLSCHRFVRILHEAGLPPEWCQMFVSSDRAASTALVTDPRVAFFSFIGSPEVGWKLRAQLAPGTRCALEHGGAAPVIVAADADLDVAIPLLAKGAFYHAGQVCVSVQRVFVHESIARELASRLSEAGCAMRVGDPMSSETEVGPLIRPAEVERVASCVAEAQEAGAKTMCGAEPVGDTCYAPTVLFDPPDHVTVSTQEVFGPVACVYPYKDIEEAFERANGLPFAFQASVFTRDLDLSMQAYSRLAASAVMVNDHPAFRVDWMPFAGLRSSGLGTGGIPHTMHDMQVAKMLVVKSSGL